MDVMLKGLRAVVTGSSRGLGFATAKLLALEGARVTINGRNFNSVDRAAQNIQAETGQVVETFTGDVSKPDTTKQLIEQAAVAMGGLDILITNSGGPPAGPFEAFDDAAWQQAFESNLMSHARLVRAAIPWLKKIVCRQCSDDDLIHRAPTPTEPDPFQ